MWPELLGIGLRLPHYEQVLNELPAIGWLEVHSENFFSLNPALLNLLTKIREYYPLSLHGVALSLGSADGVSTDHLQHLKNLLNRFEPFLVSEHLSWSKIDDLYMADLLPIPYSAESFEIVASNISRTQDFLKREILIENPSTYIEYAASNIYEADFLSRLAHKTGAKILLDINNIFVSCHNHHWDAKHYIDSIPVDLVKEIHLAGHSSKELSDGTLLLIDTHDSFVCPEVWQLYAYAIAKFGPTHTLLEWDDKIPELEILLTEVRKASDITTIS